MAETFTHCKLSDLSKEEQELVKQAREARTHAYAPYSEYYVGAAVKTTNGTVHTGCNVESAVYTLTSHAEMVAIDRAVSQGDMDFDTIAIATDDGAMPCGLCRQKLEEFTEEVKIIAVSEDGQVIVTQLTSLFPHPYTSDSLPHKHG